MNLNKYQQNIPMSPRCSAIGLIKNAIAWTRVMSSTYVDQSDKLRVCFHLTLPKWTNDQELINQDTYIIYCGNKKKNIQSYQVNHLNVSEDYPIVGHTKFLVKSRVYNVKDWIQAGFDFIGFLRQERRDMFREVQSNLILQEIGFHSKRWDDITSGQIPNNYRETYSSRKVVTSWDKSMVQESMSQLGILPVRGNAQVKSIF